VGGPGFPGWSRANPWPGINHFDVLMLDADVTRLKLRQNVECYWLLSVLMILWAFRGHGIDNFEYSTDHPRRSTCRSTVSVCQMTLTPSCSKHAVASWMLTSRTSYAMCRIRRLLSWFIGFVALESITLIFRQTTRVGLLIESACQMKLTSTCSKNMLLYPSRVGYFFGCWTD